MNTVTHLGAAVLVAACVVNGTGSHVRAQGSPTGDDRARLAASLVEAERAFARLSGKVGQVPAFLAYFADDVVTFQPAPSAGKQRLRAAAEKLTLPSPRLLDWEPWFADVSEAGDLGFTTGPSLLTEIATGKTLYSGWYFSVWKHDDNGWRVAVDVGVGAPAVDALRPKAVTTGSGPEPAGRRGTRDDLMALERDLSATAAAKGLASAYASRLGPTSRVHRDGMPPLVGEPAISAFLDGQAKPRGWRVVGAAVSASGDLAYAYGEYDTGGAGDRPQPSGFLHVWKRGPRGWLLAADIVTR
jgi:ketosteroid isomerase-like protein